MRRLYIQALAVFVLGAGLVGEAFAQRATPCSPTTPNNAVCLTWTNPTQRIDDTPVTGAITVRIEQRVGTGAYTTIGSFTGTQRLVSNLAPGSYTFRGYATEAGVSLESGPSNEVGRTATNPPSPPDAPVFTIAVNISPDTKVAPVIRILGSAGAYRRGEVFGFVPVGRECERTPVWNYRGHSYHRVFVKTKELWGTNDPNSLAAPCAPRA
jgi:hypothetical protein